MTSAGQNARDGCLARFDLFVWFGEVQSNGEQTSRIPTVPITSNPNNNAAEAFAAGRGNRAIVGLQVSADRQCELGLAILL